MLADPFTEFEVRKLREQHSSIPDCHICHEPQRCTPGRLLDTIALLHDKAKMTDATPAPATF